MRYAKPMWLNSLGVKVLLAFVAGVVLSIALLLGTIYLITTQSDYLPSSDVAERTEELGEALLFDSAGRPVGFLDSEDSHRWMYDSLRHETGYRVLDADGRVALASATGPGTEWPSTPETRRLQSGPFTFELNGVPMYAGTAAVDHQGQRWYVQFAASKRIIELFQTVFALPFMGGGIVLFSLVLLFVFGACALITLRYTLKPLRELSESAAAISPRALHARLQVKDVPAEIAPLVDSFNRVLERLEQGYRVQQGFLATAAHELKTPLALIRAQTEQTEKGQERDALLSDIQHMTRQVQQLLLLAETSEEQNYIFAVVDPRDVGAEAVGYLRRMAEAANVRLTLRHDGPAAPWRADRATLFTLLKNLLENAIQHAPAGSEVCVTTSADALTVRDNGPGVAPEQVARMFERFWRGAHRRDHGAGLGLAICQEIARAHGWTLAAQRMEPGLLFRLTTRPAPDT
ncbi:sensor histidine kinase [Massilia sp. SM-13]|uniref:sensor histidine kinase n=1 Tax=Pseudoduganella rhizocola TaxID=3382643 RepID=UPI0038B488AF